MYICIHIYIYCLLCTCVYVYVHYNTCIYMYIYVYNHIYTYICIHIQTKDYAIAIPSALLPPGSFGDPPSIPRIQDLGAPTRWSWINKYWF